MKKRLKIAILFIAAGQVSFLISYLVRPSHEIFRVDPVTFPDGSTEFWLIDDGADKVRGTEDDDVWALRFPAKYHANSLDSSRTPDQDRGNSRYKYNWDLGFFVTWPPKIDPAKDSNVSVYLTAKKLEFNGESALTRIGTYSYDFANFTTRYCSLGIEIAPRVFKMRKPSESTSPEDRNKRDETCSVNADEDYYAVYDENGFPAGYGLCVKDHFQKKTDTERICTFKFWDSVKRKFGIRFRSNLLGNVRDISEYVRKIIKDAMNDAEEKNFTHQEN